MWYQVETLCCIKSYLRPHVLRWDACTLILCCINTVDLCCIKFRLVLYQVNDSHGFSISNENALLGEFSRSSINVLVFLKWISNL